METIMLSVGAVVTEGRRSGRTQSGRPPLLRALSSGGRASTTWGMRTIQCIIVVTVIGAATGVTLTSPARASCVVTALRKQALLADCMAGCARRATHADARGRALARATCEERCVSNAGAARRGITRV